MIFDKLDNREFYYNLSPKIKAAFDFITSKDWKNLALGRYEHNEEIFANLQEYETKNPSDTEFEVHRTYIDIQYVISGVEDMAFGNLDNFRVSKEYDKEKDVAFGECPSSSVTVPEGYFTIFTPKDVHKPSLNASNQTKNCQIKKVKKVIVKIKI